VTQPHPNRNWNKRVEEGERKVWREKREREERGGKEVAEAEGRDGEEEEAKEEGKSLILQSDPKNLGKCG
jgi:hypothetical protein